MSLKIHIGCGQVYIDGYINVDFSPDSRADIMDDAVLMEKFRNNSADEIYACNVLEHLGRFRYKPALKRWYDILKPNGRLKLSVPDFRALCEYYLETGDLNSLYPALYAGQDTPWNFHYWCWDLRTLEQELQDVGFRNIQRWEDHPVRDWSINYVPYRKNGIQSPDDEWFRGKFIALNLEGIK